MVCILKNSKILVIFCEGAIDCTKLFIMSIPVEHDCLICSSFVVLYTWIVSCLLCSIMRNMKMQYAAKHKYNLKEKNRVENLRIHLFNMLYGLGRFGKG